MWMIARRPRRVSLRLSIITAEASPESERKPGGAHGAAQMSRQVTEVVGGRLQVRGRVGGRGCLCTVDTGLFPTAQRRERRWTREALAACGAPGHRLVAQACRRQAADSWSLACGNGGLTPPAQSPCQPGAPVPRAAQAEAGPWAHSRPSPTSTPRRACRRLICCPCTAGR